MRLIDAEKMKTKIHLENMEAMEAGIKAWIDRQETVDAVEVVRCKDCKWYERSRLKHDGTDDMRCVRDYCALYRRKHEPSYFCADGERRKDGKTDNC